MKTIFKVTMMLSLVLVVLSLTRQGSAHFSGGQNSQRAWVPGEPGVMFRDNFNSGNADRWQPEGGIWSVVNGRYVGEGTLAPCGFGINQSMIRDLEGSDVDIGLSMNSIQRVDKVIVLRSTNSGNQIEINFRAERPGEYPADLIVQEMVNCEQILHTPEFSVLIPPHQVGETIFVRARLTGQRLRVWIDSVLVLDQEFPFTAQSGQIGLGVIEQGTTAFDNVKVMVLPSP